MHAGAIVSMLQYFVNTTKNKPRRKAFTALHRTWGVFRNTMQRQYSHTKRARDLDTDRQAGALIPSWPELVHIAGHLLQKTKRGPDGYPPRSADVQEA